MTTFFTGDTHLGHRSILQYANRPFSTVEEMNEAIVSGWNSVVGLRDTVYHDGDVALCRPELAIELVRRLNGHKHLIFGNHDKSLRKNKDFLALWESTSDFREIKVEDPTAPDGSRRIVLCHYAMRVWNKSHHGSWHLYGHSHGSLPDDPHALSLDVGVDCWDMKPASFAQISERMSRKTWKPCDHHGEGRE